MNLNTTLYIFYILLNECLWFPEGKQSRASPLHVSASRLIVTRRVTMVFYHKNHNKQFFRTYGKGKKKSIFRACGLGNKLGDIYKVIKLVESEFGYKLSGAHIEELTKLGKIVNKLGDIDEVLKLGETDNILGETDELTINKNIKTNLLPNQQSDYVIT